jgi:hypothetical protein
MKVYMKLSNDKGAERKYDVAKYNSKSLMVWK